MFTRIKINFFKWDRSRHSAPAKTIAKLKERFKQLLQSVEKHAREIQKTKEEHGGEKQKMIETDCIQVNFKGEK